MGSTLKRCKKCGRELPLNTDYYFKKKDTRDGFTTKCKECQGYKFTNKLNKPKPKSGYKFCIKCNRELPINVRYFPQDKMCKDRFRNVCRECGADGHFMGEGYIPKTWWTKEQEVLLRKIYPHYTNEEIIANFFPNETMKSLAEKAYKLGNIHKTQQTMNRINLRKSELLSGSNSPCYGKHLSEETKLKISKSKNGKYTGVNSYWFGKKRSLKQRKEISNRLKEKGQWKGKNNPRYKKPLIGAENPNWKGGKTPIYSELRTQISEWKQKSMEYCNYRCVITGLYFDNIHHLYNFRDIVDILHLEMKQRVEDYTELEFKAIISFLKKKHTEHGLGACLVKDIHKLFHDNYGYTNNTYQQFEDFSNRYYKGEFDNKLEEKLQSYNSIKRLSQIKEAN